MSFNQQLFKTNGQVTFHYNGAELTFKASFDSTAERWVGKLFTKNNPISIAYIKSFGPTALNYFDFHPLGRRVSGTIKYADMLTAEQTQQRRNQILQTT